MPAVSPGPRWRGRARVRPPVPADPARRLAVPAGTPRTPDAGRWPDRSTPSAARAARRHRDRCASREPGSRPGPRREHRDRGGARRERVLRLAARARRRRTGPGPRPESRVPQTVTARRDGTGWGNRWTGWWRSRWAARRTAPHPAHSDAAGPGARRPREPKEPRRTKEPRGPKRRRRRKGWQAPKRWRGWKERRERKARRAGTVRRPPWACPWSAHAARSAPRPSCRRPSERKRGPDPPRGRRGPLAGAGEPVRWAGTESMCRPGQPGRAPMPEQAGRARVSGPVRQSVPGRRRPRSRPPGAVPAPHGHRSRPGSAWAARSTARRETRPGARPETGVLRWWCRGRCRSWAAGPNSPPYDRFPEPGSAVRTGPGRWRAAPEAASRRRTCRKARRGPGTRRTARAAKAEARTGAWRTYARVSSREKSWVKRGRRLRREKPVRRPAWLSGPGPEPGKPTWTAGRRAGPGRPTRSAERRAGQGALSVRWWRRGRAGR